MAAIVGLTGGIASGKSTVARTLAGLGVSVLDADQVARDVVAPGSAGWTEVVAAFGESILLPDATIDRKKLGAVVFESPDKRRILEAITHPKIAASSMERLGQLAAEAKPYCIYEAALLVETGAHRMMQAVVVVASSVEEQVRRIMKRDGLSEPEARQRLEAQLPMDRKLAAADYVVQNDDSEERLIQRTVELHAELCQRFGVST